MQFGHLSCGFCHIHVSPPGHSPFVIYLNSFFRWNSQKKRERRIIQYFHNIKDAIAQQAGRHIASFSDLLDYPFVECFQFMRRGIEPLSQQSAKHCLLNLSPVVNSWVSRLLGLFLEKVQQQQHHQKQSIVVSFYVKKKVGYIQRYPGRT